MKSLTTDVGQNAKGFLYLLATPVVVMPDSTIRTVLIVLLLIVFSFVSWLTRGNLPPEIADEIRNDFEAGVTLEEVINRGRR